MTAANDLSRTYRTIPSGSKSRIFVNDASPLPSLACHPPDQRARRGAGGDRGGAVGSTQRCMPQVTEMYSLGNTKAKRAQQHWHRTTLGGGAMTQLRLVSRNERMADPVSDHRQRMRENLLAAIVTATLLVSGAWLADELAEASQNCYVPDGGCEARGAPIPMIGFDEMMSKP
jgi:hypothetical protein